jgi:hypothetical protein
MKTLGDAWHWYSDIKQNLALMRRLGDRNWESLSSETTIWHDDRFKMLTSRDILEQSTAALAPIEDIAVMVLFSAFESQVRSHLYDLVATESEKIVDPILREAAEDAVRGVLRGSFSRHVLEPLKKRGRVPADLITQVEQVRKFRNWVAHGRRGVARNNVDARTAFRRLHDFLVALDISGAAPFTLEIP